MATNFAKYFFSPEKRTYNDEEIRIVLVGKTGAGKSASGNTILGGEYFKSGFSFKSLTEKCSKVFGEVDGHNVAVIDSPGLFDTKTDEDTTKQHIVRSISYASPGPHIFLIVVKLERHTKENKKTVQKIQTIFGDEADKYSMVLFTHGDQLKGKPIEEFLKESEDLQELVSRCNGQYHVFNNELEDRSQARELLNKIRNITEKNGGSHYTTDMFKEAEKKIEEEKQRILRENEEQRRKEQEKLQKEIEKKYEEEMKRVKADREREKQRILRENEEQRRKELEELKKEIEKKHDQLLTEVQADREKEKQLREARDRELVEALRKLNLTQERSARSKAENSDVVGKMIGTGIGAAVAGASIASLCCIS